MIRVGQGFDAHAFCEGNHIILGGVKIPFDRGIAAHSDGDVLLHALCDALLGATALGDIGSCFPADRIAPGFNSRELLRMTRKILPQHATILNVDATVITQQPKIRPFVATMRDYIGSDLNIDTALVSVKATTTDYLGFSGRGEGLAVLATATLDTLPA